METYHSAGRDEDRIEDLAEVKLVASWEEDMGEENQHAIALHCTCHLIFNHGYLFF